LAGGFRTVIELRPEGRRACLPFLAAIAAACALALQGVDLPPAPRLALLGLVIARLVLEWRGRLSPRHPDYVEQVILLPDGRWRLQSGAGRQLEARLLRGWGASQGPVIALEWACEDGRRRQAWVWRHRCPPDGWRRLRVRLRLA
jgi:hypothetical protein